MKDAVIFNEKAWSPEVARPGSPERESFLLHYAPLVKIIVARITARLPRRQEMPDLIGEGVIGLIEAANRFDPGRGIPFGVYARKRIRGAVLDFLRGTDPLPRSARDREDHLRALRNGDGRPPSSAEIARVLGISVERLERVLPPPVIVSIHEMAAGIDEIGVSEGGALEGLAAREEDPLGCLIGRERVELVRSAVAALPKIERLLMSLYYVEELTMKEVGEVMGVTESRVSQIHGRALARIRKKLRARETGFAPAIAEGARR